MIIRTQLLRGNIQFEAIPEAGEERIELRNARPSIGQICRHLGLPAPRSVRQAEEIIGTLRNLPNHVAFFQNHGIGAERLVRAVAELISMNLTAMTSMIVLETRVARGASVEIEPAAVGQTEPTLIIGDRVFTLTPRQGNGQEGLTQVLEDVRSQASQVRTFYQQALAAAQLETDRRIAEIEAQVARQTPMPQLMLSDIRRGMMAWVDSGHTFVALPFEYHPQFLRSLTRTGVESFQQISLAHEELLRRDVLITFRIVNDGVRQTVASPQLLNCSSFEAFFHYHMNCWGTWTSPEHTDIPRGVYALRDQLQAELYIINLASLANANPSELIRIETLKRDATPCNAPIFGAVTPREQRHREVTPGELTGLARQTREEVVAEILRGTILRVQARTPEGAMEEAQREEGWHV